MNISLEFDPTTGRWTMRYGAWSHEFRATRRQDMHDEVMGMGADAPDAAIAVLSLLGQPVRLAQLCVALFLSVIALLGCIPPGEGETPNTVVTTTTIDCSVPCASTMTIVLNER